MSPIHKRRLTIIALAWAVCLALLAAPKAQAEETNALVIGPSSPVHTPLEIPLRDAEIYNFKSKDYILAQRKKYLELTPQLVQGEYKPSSAVFGAMEDKKPWWGMYGRCVWGAGERSIEGPAEESRFISNPLLLVGADPASATAWVKDKIQPSDLEQPDFPLVWKPKKLVYWPDRKMAQVVYEVNDFHKEMIKWRKKLLSPVIYTAFSLVAYNARDFGFNWIWLAPDKSINIENYAEPKVEPVQIKQMIHCGGTCGYKGGCNNMSPLTMAIDRIKYAKLPARAYVALWKEKPKNVTDEPDMTFLVDLE
jgi:hypothetical protein